MLVWIPLEAVQVGPVTLANSRLWVWFQGSTHINKMYGLNALLNLRPCQCLSRRDLMRMEDTLSRSITLLNCSPEPQYGRRTAVLDLPILQINLIKHLITAIEEESDPFTLPLTPSGPHFSGTAPFTTIDELLFLCLDSLVGENGLVILGIAIIKGAEFPRSGQDFLS